MFNKRRIILFFLVLTVMLLVKYASGQEIGQVGWDRESCWDCSLSAEVYVSSGRNFKKPLMCVIPSAARDLASVVVFEFKSQLQKPRQGPSTTA